MKNKGVKSGWKHILLYRESNTNVDVDASSIFRVTWICAQMMKHDKISTQFWECDGEKN